MIKFFPAFLILLFFQACNLSQPRPDVFDCPFTELVTTDIAHVASSGIEHNIKALLNLKANTRALKFGEIGLSVGDSITIHDKLQTTEKSGMIYTAEQVVLHNKITTLICGNLKRASMMPETERKNLEAETNMMVKQYFDFLLGIDSDGPKQEKAAGKSTATKNAGDNAPNNRVEEELVLGGFVLDKNDNPLDSVLISSAYFEPVLSKRGKFSVRLTSRPTAGEVTIFFARKGYESFSRTYYKIPDQNLRVILHPH